MKVSLLLICICIVFFSVHAGSSERSHPITGRDTCVALDPDIFALCQGYDTVQAADFDDALAGMRVTQKVYCQIARAQKNKRLRNIADSLDLNLVDMENQIAKTLLEQLKRYQMNKKTIQAHEKVVRAGNRRK